MDTIFIVFENAMINIADKISVRKRTYRISPIC